MLNKRFISCICMMFLMLFSLKAQEHLHIFVDPESSLRIVGNSNINTFTLTCFAGNDAIQFMPEISDSDVKNIYALRANMVLPLKSFEADISGVKDNFLNLVKQKQYPDMKISVTHISILNSQSNDKKGEAIVEITLGGVTRSYTIYFSATAHNRLLETSGHQHLNIRDFNLEPPKVLFGLIQVKENIDIDFHMMFHLSEEKY